MDRLKRFALKKMTDKLDKVLEAKAHFDKREEKKSYTQKIKELKKHFSEIVFSDQEDKKGDAWNQITMLERMLSEHEMSTQEKSLIDNMYKKYF